MTDKKQDDMRGGEPNSPPLSVPAIAAPGLAIFAGVAAAHHLANRHGEDRPLKAIRRAEDMARKGYNTGQIHAETSKMLDGTPYAGVVYGKDGMPRFEIDDSGAKINKRAAIPAGGKAFQRDLLDHPELYKAVPSTQHVTVRKGPESGNAYLTGNDIQLPARHFASKPIVGREVVQPSVIGANLHELQHHVQDIEGFDPGGSPETFRRKFPHSPAMRIEAYKALAGEQEAEMTRNRQGMTAAQRRARLPVPEIATRDHLLAADFEERGAKRARIDMTSVADAARSAWSSLVNRDVADSKPVRFRKLDPLKIGTDPATFQFKSGGDTHGVTDRLKGVTAWDPVAAGKAVVFERASGELVIADGHQRRGLAERLAKEGQHVRMDAYVLRERDGWTPRDVYAYAAMKNIKESSGNALDMAKVMRERPDMLNGSIPMSDAKVREARNLSRLSSDAFGMVVNGMVKPEHAAAVGEAMPSETSRHVTMLKEMAGAGISSAQQAKLFVGQAMAAPQFSETTGSLFGEETNTRSLLAERTKVLDKALSALKSDKRIFSLLEREASNIESAGNRLSHEANAARATDAAQLSALVEKLAVQRGAVSDMLDQAARDVAQGKTPAQAARGFVRSVGNTMKTGGIAALTGESAAMVMPHDPNQTGMFDATGERPGWSDAARESSIKSRKAKAGTRAMIVNAASHFESPKTEKSPMSDAAKAKWEKELGTVPVDSAEEKLRQRHKSESLNKGKRAMVDDGKSQRSLLPDATTKDKIDAESRKLAAKGRVGDPINEGLFGSSKDQTDLVDMAKQSSPSELRPPVPIRKSVTADYIISLENGKKYKQLSSHLKQIGMTPDEYRAKWGLAADYPMVAPNYAAERSRLARSQGLGNRPGWSDAAREASAEVRAANAVEKLAKPSSKGTKSAEVVKAPAAPTYDANVTGFSDSSGNVWKKHEGSDVWSIDRGVSPEEQARRDRIANNMPRAITHEHIQADRARPLMKDATVKHLLKQGLVTREDVKTSGTMDDLKAKARQSATQRLKDRGFDGGVKGRSIYQEIDAWMTPKAKAKGPNKSLNKQINRAYAMGVEPPREIMSGSARFLKGYLDSTQSDTRTNLGPPTGKKAKPTSGKRGTQNAANLEAIVANRKANAKGKPNAAFEKQQNRAASNGVDLPRDIKTAKAAKTYIDGALKPTKTKDARGKSGAATEAPYSIIDEMGAKFGINSSDPWGKLEAAAMTPVDPIKPIVDPIDLINKRNETARSLAEQTKATGIDAGRGAAARSLVARNEADLAKLEAAAKSAGVKDPAAQMREVFAPKPATTPPDTMSAEAREARYVSRMKAGGSEKTESVLKAEFAEKTAASGKKSGIKSKLGAAGAILAPVAIATAMLAASNEARAEGRSSGQQVKEAAKAGAETTAVLGAWTLGTAATTTGLMRAGMTAARAIPLVQGVLMAGGAAKGAWDHSGEGAGAMLKAAARGAWDMSLPGMVVNTGIAAKDALSDYTQSGGKQLSITATLPMTRGPQPPAQRSFQHANADFVAAAKSATGQSNDSVPGKKQEPQYPGQRGWRNPLIQAKAQAAKGRTFSGVFKDGI